MITNKVRVVCEYDKCHEFEAGSWNARYCQQEGCNCKRKEESRKKRVIQIEIPSFAKEWEEEEQKKLDRAKRNRAKNKYLLENKSFAFVDIETSNLKANIGEILCACVKPLNYEPKVFAASYSDKTLVKRLREEIIKYDYIVTWYGTNFDVPFIQTRLKMNGHPPLTTFRHIDLYYTARSYLKLHSNRLNVVAESLFGDSSKTRIIGQVWNDAARGKKEALKYVIDHCVADVEELERIFWELVPFRNISATKLTYLGEQNEV